MACDRIIFLVLIVLLGSFNVKQSVHGEPKVPCFFIFGDSLVDSGNNNFLPTQAKVNYPPYGIDFPYGPTGRFCNGKTVVDILGELLGFEDFIPSFPSSFSTDILRGVNYASGSAGIRDETGQQLGARVSMNTQLKHHLNVIARLVTRFRNKVAAFEHLRSCLYYAGAGSNDYINNYFVPDHFPTSRIYTPEQYANVLINQYAQQIKRLYKYGARKVALVGVGAIGCTPNAIGKHGANDTVCIDDMNLAANMFNDRLKSLVDQLNGNFTDAKFTYVNVNGITSGNFTAGGSTTGYTGCCQVRSDGQCIPFQEPCQDREKHLFFDSFHPTEAVNQITAKRAFSAFDPTDDYPYDISHLVDL